MRLNGKSSPRAQSGDLNCQANPPCVRRRIRRAIIDTAFRSGAFAQKYAANPAILYTTPEDIMRRFNTWSDDQTS
jgi:hypothetical protein